jgi:hypothetical protein
VKRLIVLILVLLLLTGCGGLRGNSRSYQIEQETQYLTEIAHPILLSDVAYMTDAFEKQLDTQNIFLTGVVPGVSGNAELYKYFFEAVNARQGVDYLVIELPFTAGERLNAYMDTGSEVILNEVFDALAGTPYASDGNRSFFRKLYLIKKDMDIEFEIVGIDMEYMPKFALCYLVDVFKKHDLEGFDKAAELIQAQDKGFTQADYLELSFKSLRVDLEASPEGARAAFGEDTSKILHTLDNLLFAYAHSDKAVNEHFDKERSENLVRNFLGVYDTNPDAVYFGQLSNPAVMQSEHLQNDWFASAIQKARESIQGQVVSILYTYENCKRMVHVSGKAEVDVLDLFKFDDKSVLEAIDQRYTVFSMIEKDTVFNQKSVIFEKDFEGPVSDYFQYLVVINSSPPSKALD